MAGRVSYLFLIATVFLIQTAIVAKEKIYYMDFERVTVSYWNPKYFRNLNVTARRYGRSDPVHYVHVHGELLVPVGNSIMMDYYVYEFLSNEYRRSFVEAHFKLCDLLHDQHFGPLFTKHLNNSNCPLPKGVYHVENLSLSDMPFLRTFPFQKGRLYLNSTTTGSDGQRERVGNLHVDTVIKQRWR